MCVCVCVYFQYFLCIFACSCLLCLEMYIYILVLCLWRVCVRDFVRSYLYLEYLLFLTVHAFICHYIIGSPRGKSQRQAILVDAVFSPYFEIKSADIGCKLGIFTPGVTDTLWGGTFFSLTIFVSRAPLLYSRLTLREWLGGGVKPCSVNATIYVFTACVMERLCLDARRYSCVMLCRLRCFFFECVL